MKKYNRCLFLLLLFYSLVINNIHAIDKDYYKKVIKYGTDREIINTFMKVYEDLGNEINKELVNLFNEKHKVGLYNVVMDYFGRAKVRLAKDVIISELKKWPSNEDYQEAILYAVTAIKIKEANQFLMDLYNKKDLSIRIKRSIIKALGAIGNAETEDLLIKILNDTFEEKELRAEAVLALGSLKSQKAKSIIEQILKNRYEPDILRMYSTVSLGKIAGREALSILGEYIDDSSHEVAEYAISALIDIDSSDIGKYLIRGLRSDYDKVRYLSIKGIEKIRYTDAIEILEFRANYDQNDKVREEARRALELLKSK